MPRSRNIKPGLFINEKLGEAPPDYVLTFVGLWTLADKEGRLEYRPKRIKAELFPYREVDLCMALAWLMHESFITIYCVKHESIMGQAKAKHDLEQKIYIQIANWRRHQNPHHKEKESEIPSVDEGQKVEIKQILIDAKAMHESCMSHAWLKEIASTPLIPDSGFLIPDSTIPDSGPCDDVSDAARIPRKNKFSEEHEKIAIRLSNPIAKDYPHQKIDLSKWADDIRKIIELDKFDSELLVDLWDWLHSRNCPDAEFWAKNIRTPGKLRERDKQGLPYLRILSERWRQSHQGKFTEQNISALNRWLDGQGEF
jgi:hypothetical protein